MSGVDDFLAGLGGQTTSRYTGTVVNSDGSLAVNVAGNILPARVMDPLIVSIGDAVLVDVVRESRGQAAAWVIGRAAPGFRPARGTVAVVPVGSPTITVTGTDGVDYTADFVSSYTPTVSDEVILAWNTGAPTVLGAAALTAAPEPPPGGVAPPPAATQSGQSTYQAIDSVTYWAPGGWGSWARDGSHVYQGDYGSGPLTGAWFYGGTTAELAGRTIHRIRFVLGARLSVGSSNAPMTVHIKTHLSATRPGGNVALGSGAVDVTADPGQPFHEYDLPLSFAADLQAGGGIAVQGNPYGGFEGIRRTYDKGRPDSGLIIVDWSR